jgi:outer membrane protein OmpA-like peptidoglycan-associated protein
MTYLTTALFPYGTMVALLKMAGEEAGAVRLNPVEFPAAAAELDKQDRDYLGKVAKVLKERPKIAIKLCGAATRADRQALAEALAQQAAKEKQAEPKGEDEQTGEGGADAPPQVPDEQLLQLARQRAETVEDYLVTQHGVSASRAAVCRPVIDSDKAAVPRVDLQI